MVEARVQPYPEPPITPALRAWLALLSDTELDDLETIMLEVAITGRELTEVERLRTTEIAIAVHRRQLEAGVTA